MSRGIQRERDLVRKLRDEDWIAFRSPASLGRADVVALVEARDRLRRFRRGLEALTPLERRAIVGVTVGCTYDELGRRREIDNACQRARAKLRAAA